MKPPILHNLVPAFDPMCTSVTAPRFGDCDEGFSKTVCIVASERKENESCTPSPARKQHVFEPFTLESPVSPRKPKTPLSERLQKDLFQLDVSKATLALWDHVAAGVKPSDTAELASPSSLHSPASPPRPLEATRSPQPPPRRESGAIPFSFLPALHIDVQQLCRYHSLVRVWFRMLLTEYEPPMKFREERFVSPKPETSSPESPPQNTTLSDLGSPTSPKSHFSSGSPLEVRLLGGKFPVA
jgi:hypothetical protein